MKQETREWIGKAEEDFLAADSLFRRRSRRPCNIICFHCQQCAEKYLKARLVEAGTAFPRTHDLVELLRIVVAIEPFWQALEPAAHFLTNYAVAFRYPGTDATLAETKAARQHCRAIRGEVRLALGFPV